MKLAAILLLLQVKEGGVRGLLAKAPTSQQKLILQNQLDVWAGHVNYLSERMRRWDNPSLRLDWLRKRDGEFTGLLHEANARVKSWKTNPELHKTEIIDALLRNPLSKKMNRMGQRLILCSDRKNLIRGINMIIAFNNREIARRAALLFAIDDVMRTFLSNKHEIGPRHLQRQKAHEPAQPTVWQRIRRYIPF